MQISKGVRLRVSFDARDEMIRSSSLLYIQVENQVSTYDPTGYMVVYAVDDEESLETAERVLVYLKNMEILQKHAVILVANKTDMVRSRVIGPSGES